MFRTLTEEEIFELSQKNGVDKQEVYNFLSTLNQFQNLSQLNLELYKRSQELNFSLETQTAIKKGVQLALDYKNGKE